MRNLDALLTRYFGFVAAAISFALLVAAHGFEMFDGLQPCALCMDQRAVHWAAVGAGLVIGLAGRPRVRLIGLWIMAAVYLAGMGLAFYQVAVEHHWIAAPRCLATRAGWPFDPALGWVMEHIAAPFGFHRHMFSEHTFSVGHGAIRVIPDCGSPAWVFAGLTMAGWNALICLLMAFLSGRAALWKGARAT